MVLRDVEYDAMEFTYKEGASALTTEALVELARMTGHTAVLVPDFQGKINRPSSGAAWPSRTGCTCHSCRSPRMSTACEHGEQRRHSSS